MGAGMTGDGAPGDLGFAGYAAIFGREDRGGDVIQSGAFSRSLARWAESRSSVPLLWQHDPHQRIGVIDMVAQDERGLRVKGRITGGSATARRVAAMLRDGSLAGLSFGYRVIEAGQGRPRLLLALDLVEVSLVAQPMQPLARVHALAA